MNPDSQEPSFDYDVFISYSRRDIVFARALEKALEDYSPPGDLAVPQRHLVVFRDEEDFTGVEYNNSVREHLKNSAKMLVICSPYARASKFVSDEIRFFADMRGSENIIPVLLSGIPNNEAKKPEQEELKAFPRCLREVMKMPQASTQQAAMPLAASFIDLDPSKDKLYKGVFKGPWYTVLANIYGVKRSDIEQRDRKRKTRRRRITTALVAGIIAILAGALIVALIQYNQAVSERERAEKARDDAEGLIDFMVFDLREKLTPIGKIDLLESVCQQVNAYYESITAEKPSQENLRKQGFALDNYGLVLFEQGKVDEALDAITVSRDIRYRLVKQDPGNSILQRDLAASYTRIGDILFEYKFPTLHQYAALIFMPH